MSILPDLTPAEVELINERLVIFNMEAVPVSGPYFKPLNLALRDESGALTGGVVAELHGWHILFVYQLWVNAEHRKGGHGAKLLRAVEDIARQKGAKIVLLETFDFQAPDFYRKQGYDCYATLPDCPEGHTHYYFKKILN